MANTQQIASLAKARAVRQLMREEGMAAAREWKERHRRLGTVWGVPPQPVCAGCGRPM
jgi:hypothetical protein